MSVPLMLFVTPGMVITLINQRAGGEDVVAVEDDYRYSDVERFVQADCRIYDRCLKGWIEMWALIFP